MGERVGSDHPSVTTYRGRIESTGAVSRPRLVLPPEATETLSAGVVRIVLDGSTYHAEVRDGGDGLVISGVYDSPRLARSPGDGENRLPGWVDEAGLEAGRSVLVDEVVPGTLYGARAPGTQAVYDAIERPRSSLRDIAEGLDG